MQIPLEDLDYQRRAIAAAVGVFGGQVRNSFVETKSTNNLDDPRALTESERLKIRCAIKHFEAIGIDAKLDYRVYHAPVREYRDDFKNKVLP